MSIFSRSRNHPQQTTEERVHELERKIRVLTLEYDKEIERLETVLDRKTTELFAKSCHCDNVQTYVQELEKNIEKLEKERDSSYEYANELKDEIKDKRRDLKQCYKLIERLDMGLAFGNIKNVREEGDWKFLVEILKQYDTKNTPQSPNSPQSKDELQQIKDRLSRLEQTVRRSTKFPD